MTAEIHKWVCSVFTTKAFFSNKHLRRKFLACNLFHTENKHQPGWHIHPGDAKHDSAQGLRQLVPPLAESTLRHRIQCLKWQKSLPSDTAFPFQSERNTFYSHTEKYFFSVGKRTWRQLREAPSTSWSLGTGAEGDTVLPGAVSVPMELQQSGTGGE